MFNILDAVIEGFSRLNTPVGFTGSMVTILDHFKTRNSSHIQETLDAMRKKSGAAYAQYCEYRSYRPEELGIPLEQDILGYWETCLGQGVLPSADDLVSRGIASEEEAKIIISYLMEQWMTVPDFSSWFYDMLTQNHLEKISQKLSGLPQILDAAAQIKAELSAQGIDHLATLITPGYVNGARLSCDDLTIQNFFTVDNNFYTMLQVISADEDVPHTAAARAAADRIQAGSPVIIAGNGGQGKTSLMMRAAVQWASSGHLAAWMSLSNKEIITEQQASLFFERLLQLTPAGQSILLCIDNPFEGRESLSSLQARWPHNPKLRLIMAERENRLTLLADPDQDLLLRWFDSAELLVLQGLNRNRTYHLKDYQTQYFPESRSRREDILKKSTSHLVRDHAIREADQLSVINRILGQYRNPNISLVELIYRTLFELKKISSKPGSIKLDWEEWGDLIHREFGTGESALQLYGVIAALKIFNIPLPLPLFCKYFRLDERRLRTRLCERSVSRHVEPVVFQEGSKTLQPKHDVIAELFFLFHKDRVTVNSLILDLIDVMDENEVEAFLANILNKREMRRGTKYPIGPVDYWGYMGRIYSRTQNGSLNLSRDGRANLCLGFLWAGNQKMSGTAASIETVLDRIAPEIESDLLMAKLYTEWGIWAANQKAPVLAEEKFLAVIEYNSRQLPPRTELGRLLAKQRGREGEAEQFLREAISIDPKHIQSRTELGRLLAKQKGREGEAEDFLREAIRIDPKNLHPHTELGRLLAKQKGREGEAEQFLRRAMEIDPRHIQSRTELGRLLAKQKGREREAENFFREAMRISPKDIQSRTELGRLLAKQEGREGEAEDFLREAIHIDPKNLHPHTELGRLLAKQEGREGEAEIFFRKEMEIDPKHIQSRTELGRLLAKQKGREGEAEQFLREAMEIAPKDLHSRTVLARLYERMNKLPEAIQLYRELCELDPGNRFGEAGLSRLQKH